MKKVLSIILVVLTMSSFVGCGREEKEVFDDPASSFDGQENILTENIEVEETLTENVEDEKSELEIELDIDRLLREQVCEESKNNQYQSSMTKEDVAVLFEEHGLNEEFIMDKIK